MTEVAPETAEIKAKTNKDVSLIDLIKFASSPRCLYQQMKCRTVQSKIEAAQIYSAALFSLHSWWAWLEQEATVICTVILCSS
jgi:hypothetical protein